LRSLGRDVKLPVENPLITLPHSVYFRFWDCQCLVYQAQTGHTHLVEGLGTELFKIMASQPVVTRLQLLENLNQHFDWPANFDLNANLDALLTEYQNLHLLEVVNHPAA